MASGTGSLAFRCPASWILLSDTSTTTSPVSETRTILQLQPGTSSELCISKLPSWKEAKRVAIDIETYDPNLKDTGPSVRTGGFIAGVAFAIEDGPAHYIPIAHLGGGNVDRQKAIRYLQDQSREFKGIIVGTNLQYDMDFLAQAGVTFWDNEWRDISNVDPLINELQFSYSLANIANRYGFAGKQEDELLEAVKFLGLPGDPKVNIWKLPGDRVAKYAIGDVTLPLQILRRQERIVEEEGLWDILKLESRLQKVLLKMRRRGVRIDLERLDWVDRWAQQHRNEALEKVRSITGHRIESVWSAENVAPAIRFTGANIPLTREKKLSIDSDFLESTDHEVFAAVSRARKFDKVSSTFAASIRRYLVGDRIHTTFNQLKRERDDGGGSAGAAYGRTSSQDPNLQQQPARDEEIGPVWRTIFVPDDGGIWACNDFSQQEPRVLVHYAERTNCTRAKEAADVYRRDPKADNHTMMARLIDPNFDSYPKDRQKIIRSNAKIIFLARCYGMGDGKLCKDLGLPTVEKTTAKGHKYLGAGPEGQAIIDQFNMKVPFVRELAKKCEINAKKFGYIRTILGRRCRFPKKPDGTYDWTHKALNRLIQGSSGDQTKQALIDAEENGLNPQLQVHDEIDTTVSSVDEAKRLAKIMREAVQLTVPMRVDVEVGPNWGDIHAVE